ncbi:capsid protein [Eubacterium multiforme]|uniref:Nucleic acid-binding protein n=1 Tax=Eubacterium multiforme TaxID=83339 RepID=A0ABT9USN9_9FIRM|nr:capsid protein [Eubacterium multiforme]MDQ0149343.1 putative nucleic acid-binding protein [Eubacterium multiforme]
MGWFKSMLTNAAIKLLDIQPAIAKPVIIKEPLSFEGNVMKNRMWYRGDPSELDQFFKGTVMDQVSRSRFWAAVPSDKLNIRKMHSGLPAIIVETLADIVVSDISNISIEDKETFKLWEDISNDNKFYKLLKKSLIETLVTGDGAYKITIDTDITLYPILEFYSGERVDYTIKRGRLQEVLFYTDYSVRNNNYRLIETFGKGYIRNKLIDQRGAEVPLNTIPELSELKDVTYDGKFIMAIPLKFFESQKWSNRGKSLFDNKADSFDSLDEVISQWIDAIRNGRVQKYIPEDLLPKDSQGQIMEPNPFDNQFIKIGTSLAEDAKNEINMVQPEIRYEAFIESYAKALDMCLQGIISPATLGIDLKKLDNAEAQREKEKTTLYTRKKIVDELQEVIPELINTLIKVNSIFISRKAINDALDVTIDFGEYASPSFNDKVETIGKAKNYGVMSIEQCVEELYGDTWTEEEKEEEIKRLKDEQGLNEVDEPKSVDDEDLNLEDEEDGQEE